MFAKDHVCEPEKLRAASALQEGGSGSQPQQVDSAASDQINDEYKCDECGQKYANVNDYSFHLDFHEQHPQIRERIEKFQREKALKENNEGGPAPQQRVAAAIEEEKKDDNGSAAKQA